MLCPNCLQNVDRFEDKRQPDNSLMLTCALCNELVPVRYRDDYDRYPPVVFSLVGLRGHGKTVFFSTLLSELDGLAKANQAFSYTPLDEAGLKTVREAQRALELGHLPGASGPLFRKPAILQLDGMRESRRFRLLVYDIGGEVFENVSYLKQYGGYVSRGRSTVWLIRIPKLGEEKVSPRDLEDFVTRYVQVARELGGQAKNQTLLIVLTMGDLLLEQTDITPKVRDFLLQETPTKDYVDTEFLGYLSRDIEEWLEAKPGYQNFVRRVQMEFAEVEYCVISALGSAPHGQTQLITVTPRGVLAPLRWLLHFERERQELREDVSRLEADLGARSEMIEKYFGKATLIHLDSEVQKAKQTVEEGSIEQARVRVREVRVELLQSVRRAQLLRFGRYVAVALVGCIVVAGLGWIGRRLWMRGQRTESWYLREHLAELMTDGGVLELPAGDYVLSARVALHKPLSLKGGGRERTRIVCKQGSSGLMYAGQGVFAAADLTFEYSGAEPANVVTIQAGQVDFQRCRFTGGKRGQGLRNSGNGAQLMGRSTGTISDCEFSGNGLNGLSIDEQSEPTLAGNVVQQNQAAGIAYSGYSAGTVQNTNCNGNQTHGIQIVDQARPVLQNGVCSGNQRSGISLSGTSTGAAKNYRCFDNRLNGITVEGQAEPTLEGNTCQTNKGSGIAYFDNSSGSARQNQCIANDQSGIAVKKRAHPTLEANGCRENARFGIVYLDEGGGAASKNECANNRMSGFSVEGQAQPVLVENTSKENRNSGIRYVGNSSGTAQGNTIVDNKADGILVRDRSHPVLDNNVCRANDGSGISYSGKATGFAHANKCVANGVNGLIVADGADPELEENEYSDNHALDYRDWRMPEPEQVPVPQRPLLFWPERKAPPLPG
jgi:parallel beta-helix repeat protein